MDGVNFYIKNLHKSINDNDLRELFAPYGKIMSARVMKELGESRGFGFVSFESRSVTETVLKEMNGKFIRSKAIYVAIAQKKEDRARELALCRARRAEQFTTPI